ncbi:MAG: hypothetical protein U0354_07480 [Candidatus Sericytochromatia bacterium]
MNNNSINVLVISSCNGEKKYYPDNKALARDLDDIFLRQKKEDELKSYKTEAHEMFISLQNKTIIESINLLNKDNVNIDLCFISSGYGLLNFNDEVIPYDINLSAFSMYDLDKRSSFLRIHEEVYYKSKNYNLIIFLLGYEYLRMLKLPIKLEPNIKQIFFISPSDEKVLPDEKDFFIVKTGNEEASRYNITPSELKGFIFKSICLENKRENVFKKIHDNPEYINKIMKKYIKKAVAPPDQLNLFSNQKQMSLFDLND